MIPIRFDPTHHRYTGPQGPYISATQLVELAVNKFNTEEESIAMAERRGMTPEYWLDKWKKENKFSLLHGTRIHELQEALSYASGVEVRKGKVLRVQNSDRLEEIIDDYFYWPDGVYNELLLWNEVARVAGRADKVLLSTTMDGTRKADIEDHKTNKRIERKSWYDKLTGYRMMKSPVEHLMDCNFYHYALQLSIYQLLLELMGFEPGTRTLLHYPPIPEDLADYPGERVTKPIRYELPYLRGEVINLIKYYHNA